MVAPEANPAIHPDPPLCLRDFSILQPELPDTLTLSMGCCTVHTTAGPSTAPETSKYEISGVEPSPANDHPVDSSSDMSSRGDHETRVKKASRSPGRSSSQSRVQSGSPDEPETTGFTPSSGNEGLEGDRGQATGVGAPTGSSDDEILHPSSRWPDPQPRRAATGLPYFAHRILPDLNLPPHFIGLQKESWTLPEDV